VSIYKSVKRILFALTHPSFTLRRLKVGAIGASTIELNEIAKYSSNFDNILEAGAADGEDTERLLKMFPASHVYAFEPVRHSYVRLVKRFINEPRVKLFNAALSFESKGTTLYVSSNENSTSGEGSSSLLRPTKHLDVFPMIHFLEINQEFVRTVNLDEWSINNGIKGFDLIWLDLQGMEQLVIESAPLIIGNSHLIYIEVSRKPLFEGGASYQGIDEFLKSKGYVKRIERVGLISGNVLYERRT